jgi:hypothetical protein
MIFEILGAVIDKGFFWRGVGKVVEAGADAGFAIKNSMDEEKKKRLESLQTELREFQALPDFQREFVNLASVEDRGRLATPWSYISENLQNEELLPDSYDVDLSKLRRSSKGDGWLWGSIDEDESLNLAEICVLESVAFISIATRASNDIWCFLGAEIHPQNGSIDSHCDVVFKSSLWSQNEPSWSDILFGPSSEKLEALCTQGLSEFASGIFKEFDKISVNTSEVAKELDHLVRLKQDGHLSESEFAAAKSKLLGL